MDPTIMVINRIRESIADGSYKPNTRLPSERVLAESMNTSRGYVRKALQRLELYGVVKIRPQSGVYIAELGASALEGLITNILAMDPQSVGDFIETRSHLEVLSARLAAERADETHMEQIRTAHQAYIDAFETESSTLEADHLFHLAIVGATENSVLQSLISLLTPDIIALNRNFIEEHDARYRNTPQEHQCIVDAIAAKDPHAASVAMSKHMEASRIRRMGRNQKEDQGLNE